MLSSGQNVISISNDRFVLKTTPASALFITDYILVFLKETFTVAHFVGVYLICTVQLQWPGNGHSVAE